MMLRNDGEDPVEFDRDDGICGVQLVDRTEIRVSGEATEEMRSGLAPKCSALFAQYELGSKADTSGRWVQETYTAVSQSKKRRGVRGTSCSARGRAAFKKSRGYGGCGFA